MSRQFDFRYAPTLRRAINSDAPVKIVQGPVESGKTVWLIMQMYMIACTIPRCLDGIRRSRFLIQRTTEGELKRGIMRTYANIFPEDVFGEPQGSMPAIHLMKFLDVEMEVEFFAFEDATPAVLKKLRSTEYTAILVNEGQFVSMELFLAMRQRAGRYPPRDEKAFGKLACPGYDKKRRIFMDMNAPQVMDHWVSRMRQAPGDPPLPADMSVEERRQYRKPKDWEFFMQPAAVKPIYDQAGHIEDFEIHPDIENLPYQDADAILSMCATGDIDDIRRDYMNELVQAKSGKPRYPKFSRQWHVAKERMKPVDGVPPVIGYDPGLSGAAVFLQKVNGQWRGFKEMFCRNNAELNSASKQGDYMLDVLRTMFPWYKETGVGAWGDPYGGWGGTSAEETFYSIIAAKGLVFRHVAPKDNPTLRHEMGKKVLSEGEFGQPKLLLCPHGCPNLIEAFDGGAVMQTVRKEGSLEMTDKLVKPHKYADIIEAVEYAFWGGGEDHAVIEAPVSDRPPPRTESIGTRNILSKSRKGRTWKRRVA